MEDEDLRLCTAAIMALLTFLSWQRPRAAANLMYEEYQNRRLLMKDKEEYMVLAAKEHKTGISDLPLQ